MRQQRSMFQVREQDKTPEKELNETKINNLPDKVFKQKVIRMLNDLGRRMDELSENGNKEFENIKKNQSEMKNTILEMKNSLEGFNSRVGDTEEWISKLDERLEEITQAEPIKEKRIKKNENSLRDLCNNIKCTNICIISVPEGEEIDKGAENLFEEITAENFPNLKKETDI
uniref:L1 transposable element RRM domain-containing protein n=1 Tax=Equus caballus TaxID=9796 RepID=A0A9L0T2X6_HORSE